MPTATQSNTTPTRRSALGFSAAAIIAGLATPVLAKGVRPEHTPDATLVDLCDQFVTIETERYLLAEHDDYAPDFGPNNARYEHLSDEIQRLIELFAECQPATSPAGHTAVARVALTWIEVDSDGDIKCSDFGEEMMILLAQGLAPDFVWPPRPGSCSTAHWAPPSSPAEVAEHRAAYDAEMARISAEAKAKRAAERDRRQTPSLLTDGELRKRIPFAEDMRNIAVQMHAELADEAARRGLA